MKLMRNTLLICIDSGTRDSEMEGLICIWQLSAVIFEQQDERERQRERERAESSRTSPGVRDCVQGMHERLQRITFNRMIMTTKV